MVIQNPDGTLVREHHRRRIPAAPTHTYYAELPRDGLDEGGSLIEHLFAFAIDVLDARHVEVRVMEVD